MRPVACLERLAISLSVSHSPTTGHGCGMPAPRPVEWLLRDRSTGNLVVVQWPNVPLWIFIVSSAVKRLVTPQGSVGTVVAAVAVGALMWWALGEILRGVNPFRRGLGVVVAAVTIAGLVLS